MYVLLYVDVNKQPCYIQGSMEEINSQLRTLWMNHCIDRYDWDLYDNWQLLGVEDGCLTPMNRVDCVNIPYFET